MFICIKLSLFYLAQWGHVGREILERVFVEMTSHGILETLGVSQWWSDAALNVLWSNVGCDVFRSIAPMHEVVDDDGVRQLVSILNCLVVYTILTP